MFRTSTGVSTTASGASKFTVATVRSNSSTARLTVRYSRSGST